MAQVKSPFYVSFTHDQIPQSVGHSQARPGPAGGSPNRAGHTRVTSAARLTYAWEEGTRRNNGPMQTYLLSFNVFFRLTDFLIGISSDFTARSCAYRATLRHELDAHIYDPIRIFHSYRDILVGRLNAIAVPTRQSALHVASVADGESRKAQIEERIKRVVGDTRRELLRDLMLARSRHDSGESYQVVYRQCTDAQWASGR